MDSEQDRTLGILGRERCRHHLELLVDASGEKLSFVVPARRPFAERTSMTEELKIAKVVVEKRGAGANGAKRSTHRVRRDVARGVHVQDLITRDLNVPKRSVD
jgi:hypothetical protein